jgi:phage head maturation protease
MRRGDIIGMSFAFEDDWQDSENGVSYERTGETHAAKEVWLRHVKRIIGLYDVAIVTHPAYEQTSVGTREQSDRINAAIDEQIKREAGSQETDEEREAREKAEREQAEREANGGETNAEKEAREQKEREERELEEQAQRAREARMLRLHGQRIRLENDF